MKTPAGLALAILVFAALGRSTAAQESPAVPEIVAQGDATVRRAADLAWVQVAVEARGSTPAAARQQAAAAMSSVLNTLKKSLPSDAIRTASFSIQPEMEFPDNRPRVRDYVARNQLDVRVDDLDTLPGVLDASVSGGATSVAGLRFDLKNRDDAEREALQLAVKDAMARAEAIAKGAGRTVGAIVRITEQRSFAAPLNRTMEGVAFSQRESTPTPISPGEIEIRGQVTATVQIK